MQDYILPINTVVDYVHDIVDQLPVGHTLPTRPRERNNQVTVAAAAFVENYIRGQLRHVRKRPDAFKEFLHVLGYPVMEMRAAALDDFCEGLDDFFVTLTIISDPIVRPFIEMTGTRLMFITHRPGMEELVIELGDDYMLEKYRLIHERTRLVTPSRIRDISDLDGFQEYFDNTIGTAFSRINNQAVRDEVKRIAIETIRRQ